MPKTVRALIHATLIIFSLVAIVIGLKLRFSNLSLPFWGDEFQTLNVALGIGRLPGQPSLIHAWKLQRLEMMHPPAFMVLLHFWAKVGLNTAWIRLLPSLIGLVGLVYLVKIGVSAGSKLTSILPLTSLTASSWAFVHYSEEVGSYSLAITASFALIYYVCRYFYDPNGPNYLKLLAASLANLFVYFGSWFYLPVVVGVILYNAIQNKKYHHVISFIVISGLAGAWLYFDQLRFKWGFAVSDYLTKFKLSSVSIDQLPTKIVKDNLDFLAYVLGATPWHLDATFFPTIARFGSGFFTQYYVSLLFIGLILLSYFVYLCKVLSRNTAEFIGYLLPLYFLASILLAVNLVSLIGLYPIGPIRMSLFYAPVVIWLLLQYIDLLFKRFSVFTLIAILFIMLLTVNGIVRLSRIPQKHIGNQSSQPLYYSA